MQTDPCLPRLVNTKLRYGYSVTQNFVLEVSLCILSYAIVEIFLISPRTFPVILKLPLYSNYRFEVSISGVS